MNVLDTLNAKRTRLLADVDAVTQAIKALTPVLGNGQVVGAKMTKTNGTTRTRRTRAQRANISAGLKAAWERRKAGTQTPSTTEATQ